MKGALDPRTLEKIEAFGRRRRRLILLRGLCAAVATLLAAMTAIAFVDGAVLLADEVRWALSAAGYAAVAVALWLTCARLFLHSPGPRTLARFIEQARPELREDLLSAVELGDSSAPWDSEEFREMLQKSVAERIQDVHVDSLLSIRRIGAWIRAAAVAVAAVGALLLLPGLQFDNLLLRSLLPMANLERPSRIQVAILQPNPPDAIVAQGDTVPIAIEVSGGDVKTAEIDAGRARAEMKPGTPGRFESAIAVGREPVSWRVRAGDRITRRFTLTPRPRPEVARFHKTFNYPAYTGRAPKTVAGTDGGLSELEGTEVDLVLEANQAIRSGELRLELGGKPSKIALEADGPGRLRARVPIAGSGTYRVHLVGEETGFENKFSPQYEIRALPDLVPRVALKEPALDQMLPPDEIVDLRGTARDDLGLRSVTQLVRVNQGDWTETALLIKEGALDAAVSRRWDLLELRVQPGDHVTVKLAAIDLKGNRAESAPVHVTITSPSFDPQRLVPLAAKEAVYAALVVVRDATRALEKRVKETAPATDELARRQALLDIVAETEKVALEVEQAGARVREALRFARAGRESHDLTLVGRLLLRIRVEAYLASEAERLYRDILASEEAVTILGDLADLARDQAAINRKSPAAADAKGWERLSRRQDVAANQIKGVEDIFAVLAQRTKDDDARRAQKLREDLKQRRVDMERVLSAPPGQALAAPSGAMKGAVDAAFAQHAVLERDIALRAQQARAELDRKVLPSWADVQALRKEPVAPAWKRVRAQLDFRAELEEARRDADPFFVADAALAALALGATLDVFEAGRDGARAQEHLQIIERAFRTLETGHSLAELSNGLRALAESVRWDVDQNRALKDWVWLQSRSPLKKSPVPAADELDKLHVEASKALAAAQPSMDEARELLARLVPSLAERLAQLAEAAERARKSTAALAAREEPSQVRQESRDLLDRQQAIDRQIEEAVAELRRDANVQDLLTEEGRERARDADDATAMLHESPPKTEELLGQAAAAQEPRRALEEASEQQGKMAEALRTLAKHYDNLAKGKPEETRPVLREAEAALGLKAELDARYRAMAKLADLAKLAPEAALGQLEGELSGNEAMQRKLEELAQGALDRAEAALGQAAQQERRAAEGLQRAAQEESKRYESLAQKAQRIAVEARRIAQQDAATVQRRAERSAQPDAKQAARAAQEAARALEQGAQTVEKDAAQAARQLDQAAQNLQAAAQKLQSAAQADQQAAQRADREAQQADQQDDAAGERAAQARSQAAKLGSQSAQSAQAQAGPSATKVVQLAQEARELAQAVQKEGQSNAGRLAQAALQQAPIAQAVGGAQKDVAQAARHQERLGNAETADALEGVAKGVGETASREIPAAQRALKSAQNSAQAQPAVAAAQQSIERQAQALAQARAPAAPAPGRPAESAPGALSDTASAFLAQALNSLDAGPPGPAAQAASSAAQAQAASMRQARAPGQGQTPGTGAAPGQMPGSQNPGRGTGASVEGGVAAPGRLADLASMRGGAWGKLPPKLARDLLEAQRENVSGEYRNMVETYFRVVAERARK